MPAPADLLPDVSFGPYRVTRLIGGHNPLCGGSHWSPSRNREMAEYHTPERVVAHLHRLCECGINTLLARGDYHRVLYWIELFRREGGHIQWIAQTASEMHDVFQNIRILAAAGAIGIYHHGTQTDRWWVEGSINRVKDYLSCIRDQGVQVGLATHYPEVIEYAEEKGWDIDFYMTCFYNLNRRVRESDIATNRLGRAGEVEDDSAPTVNEDFRDDDPPRMVKVIQAVGKQCLAFKVLGAGRRCATQDDVAAAFRYAFANIKPGDAVVVGMWQKHRDEIALNVRHTREALRQLDRGTSLLC